jgi:hypothetical protein
MPVIERAVVVARIPDSLIMGDAPPMSRRGRNGNNRQVYKSAIKKLDFGMTEFPTATSMSEEVRLP